MTPQQQQLVNHQLIKFNVGGKVFYTTRETITNSFHHTAIYNIQQSSSNNNNNGGRNTHYQTINDFVFPGNCLPFSQKVRSPTAYQQQQQSQPVLSKTTTTTTTTNSSNSGSSNGDSPVPSNTSSVYNSLSTYVDLHNRKSRMSFSDTQPSPYSQTSSSTTNQQTSSASSTTTSVANNNVRTSSASSVGGSGGPIENYFTRLLDENQHWGIMKDETGCFFIDRNPKYFALILEYLKSGELNLFDSSEYRSSELDTPEYGFHDLQLFAQKIIKEADYFMVDVSDQLYNIVGDQLYVSDCFQDRTNRSNQRCLIFFDKDPLRRPCSLYMSGIWFDRHIVDKECFVRNGVIEIYMDENSQPNEFIGRKRRANPIPSQQYSGSGVSGLGGNTSDLDADSEGQTKRKSYDSNNFFSSLSSMVSNMGTTQNQKTQKSGPVRLQFVIHPQVDVKNNEKITMMNFIGVDPSILDMNGLSVSEEKSTSANVNDFSSLFSTYGMLGASRRLSMEFPQLVENVLVVKDITSFKKEFRLKEMIEPSISRVQFNKKYFNLSDYNHSIKIMKDEKDSEYVTIIEYFTIVPDKFGTGNIENNPNITTTGPTSGNRRVASEIPIGRSLSNLSEDSRVGQENKGLLEDLYLEVASSDDDEFSVPQPLSSKRKSINPNLQKNRLTVSKVVEQTKETRMRLIMNNFFAKSKKEFLYIESKNRIYWVSFTRGLITLELSNKNL